jgi:4-oxalocrotonate tautomerase
MSTIIICRMAYIQEADMPFIQISVPAGSLTPEQKSLMIQKVTDAAVEAEGLPVKQFTFVHLNEVPDGGWGSGGNAVTLAQMKAKYNKK